MKGTEEGSGLLTRGRTTEAAVAQNPAATYATTTAPLPSPSDAPHGPVAPGGGNTMQQQQQQRPGQASDKTVIMPSVGEKGASKTSALGATGDPGGCLVVASMAPVTEGSMMSGAADTKANNHGGSANGGACTELQGAAAKTTTVQAAAGDDGVSKLPPAAAAAAPDHAGGPEESPACSEGVTIGPRGGEGYAAATERQATIPGVGDQRPDAAGLIDARTPVSAAPAASAPQQDFQQLSSQQQQQQQQHHANGLPDGRMSRVGKASGMRVPSSMPVRSDRSRIGRIGRIGRLGRLGRLGPGHAVGIISFLFLMAA